MDIQSGRGAVSYLVACAATNVNTKKPFFVRHFLSTAKLVAAFALHLLHVVFYCPAKTAFRFTAALITWPCINSEPFVVLRNSLGNLAKSVSLLFKLLISIAVVPFYPAWIEARSASASSPKSKNIAAFQELQNAIKKGFYTHCSEKVSFAKVDAMIAGTESYDEPDLAFDLSNSPSLTPEILVTNQDTMELGKGLIEEGFNPVVLNMANKYSPGGGVVKGCSAQEEELCRLSTLYCALADQKTKGKYPIPEFGCIYSPYVETVRQRQGNAFVWLEEPKVLSVISSAAYDLRPKSKVTLSDQELEEGTKAKMRCQLQVAIAKGHNAIVLGAFGCGAFRQDANLVAQWYKEVLNEGYAGYFQKIHFAVLVVHDSDQENLNVFRKTFTPISIR